MFWIPKTMIKKSEAIHIRFFWHGGGEMCMDDMISHGVEGSEVRRWEVWALKNIKDFKLAVLCKWLWKLGAREGRLWVQVIRQRY